MHVNVDRFSARRRPRVVVAAVAVALSLGGLLIGPDPLPARAALVATGINDSHSMSHDRIAAVPAPGVLGNDLNLVGGSSAILVSGASHGTLDLRSDGGYTYVPAAGYVGSDTFDYRPSGLLSTPATVTITITNAVPVAHPDAYAGQAGTTLVVEAPGVLANDEDTDGDALTAAMVGGGVPGSLTLDADGGLRYTPGGGFSGTATFSYKVSDGVAWSDPTTVTLNIVASAPTPTPTPTPTPAPIVPLPTAAVPLPLPSPLTLLPLAPGTPSAPPVPTPPGGGTTTLSPGPASPEPSSGPNELPGAALVPPASSGTDGEGSASASPDGATGPSGGGADTRLPSVRFDDRRLGLTGASVGLLAGIEIWAVPAASIALPGLLVLIWVALQTVGAIAWIPAVRRFRRDDNPPRRRFRTPAS